MPRIEVICKQDGSVKIDAQGFSGGACEKATEPLRARLGGTGEIAYKPEYFTEVEQKNNLEQGR